MFAYSEDEIRRAAESLTDPAVPPAELEVRARRAFAEHQRVAGAVGDCGKRHSPVLVEHTILAGVILAGDAKVACECDEVPRPLRHLSRPRAGIARAGVGLDDRAAVSVRRVGERLIRDSERGQTFGVDVLLLDVRQDVERPAGEGHGARCRTMAHWQCVVGIVIQVQSQGHLFDVILASRASGGTPHTLHCGQQQSHQDADDRNDDEEFEEGECLTV